MSYYYIPGEWSILFLSLDAIKYSLYQNGPVPYYILRHRVHFQWNRYTVITVFLEYMLAQWVSAQRNKISRFEYPQNTRYEFEFSMVLVPVRYSIVSVLQGGVQSRVLLRTKLLVQT